MGREWYWSRPVSPRPDRDATPGCMSGVLNSLDCTRPPPSSPPRRPWPQHIKPPLTSISSSGLEAPRNSLELEDAPPPSASTSAAASDDYYFDIPLGIQVPTRVSSLFDEERRDAHSLAATPRTPNVVARLMGLEILPDAVSSLPARTRRTPSRSVPPTPVVAERPEPERHRRSKRREAPQPVRVPLHPRNLNVNLKVETGSISLPETPRPSSSRPSEADPRPSLQLNKENSHRAMNEFGYLCEVFTDTAKSRRENIRPLEESKSPRNQYSPREIVKLVKDSINNKRLSTAAGGGGGAGDDKGSRSRRNRQTEKKVLPGVMLPSPCSTTRSPFVESPLSSPPPWSKCKEGVGLKGINMTPSGCKKDSFERYTEKIKKKKKNPSPAATKKQSRIAPASVRSSRQQPPPPPRVVLRETVSLLILNLPMERDPEFLYVRSILDHAGVQTPATQAVRWYSASLPVDPIIFHRLELELPFLDLKAGGDLAAAGLGPLRHRWNRKLLFHVVEEVLGVLLSGAAGRRNAGAGESLLMRLWGRIRSFPAVDCKVVGDIDALVEGDFREPTIRGLLGHPSVAAEAESITSELVKGILDSLVDEAASASLSLGGAASGKRKCSCGDQLSLE